MKAYCKAYSLDRFRAFPQWSSLAAAEIDATVTDDDYAFLCDDLTVLIDPINETRVLISDATEDWRRFCEESLDFAVPEDLRELLDGAAPAAPSAAR